MSGETEKDMSGWTVDTLNYFFQQQIDDMRRMLDERYSTQIKATDAAFAAQQKAMETAFIAADKAVQTALLSAEKAVTKAEAAAEKRFESVNEFRGTLSDQQKNFLPRQEYDAAHDNLVDRVTELQDRMNRSEGKGQGYAAFYGWAVAGISLIITVVVFANSLTR